jgi:glycine oxidase
VLVRSVASASGRARGVETSEGLVEAESTVIAAGSWSSLVGGLPEGLAAVRPVRGQIVQVETRPPIVKRIVFGDGGYVLARPDGRTLLGSTMEEVGHVKEITAGGVHQVLSRALAILPSLATAPISATWAGCRPATDAFASPWHRGESLARRTRWPSR